MKLAIIAILVCVALAGVHKVTVERHQKKRSESLGSGVFPVVLENNKDISYLGNLGLGDNTYKSKLIFDTGSSGLWVGVTGCSGCSANYPLYTCAADCTNL